MGVTVCSEQSSCPCFAAALTGKPVSRSDGLWRIQGSASRKRKIPPTQRSDGFCRVNRRQNWSGVLRGGAFFLGNHLLKVVVITVRTTTFSVGIWNKGYHGRTSASIWFCKIYCGKAVEVGLIDAVRESWAAEETDIVSIYFFAICEWREVKVPNLLRKVLVFPLRWHRLALVDSCR